MHRPDATAHFPWPGEEASGLRVGASAQHAYEGHIGDGFIQPLDAPSLDPIFPACDHHSDPPIVSLAETHQMDKCGDNRFGAPVRW